MESKTLSFNEILNDYLLDGSPFTVIRELENGLVFEGYQGVTVVFNYQGKAYAANLDTANNKLVTLTHVHSFDAKGNVDHATVVESLTLPVNHPFLKQLLTTQQAASSSTAEVVINNAKERLAEYANATPSFQCLSDHQHQLAFAALEAMYAATYILNTGYPKLPELGKTMACHGNMAITREVSQPFGGFERITYSMHLANVDAGERDSLRLRFISEQPRCLQSITTSIDDVTMKNAVYKLLTLVPWPHPSVLNRTMTLSEDEMRKQKNL